MMMVRNWGASSIAADKIAAAHKMAFEILGLFNFFFILFSSKLFQKIISRCGCFFYPDRPPVIYQVEIGKVVEKVDVET